jgi:2-hydroxychromene-2-carboxylate isomerase
MAKTVDYYFSPMSPWTYLGHQRFADILARSGAQVKVKPVDYGRIFPVSGGLPVKQRALQRQAYRLVELRRWRDFLGVPLNVEPKHFPYAADSAALLIIAADRQHGTQAAMKLALGILRACWAEERNCADAGTLDQIAAAAGVDGYALRSRESEAKAAYDAYTQEAIERQVFGAPSYVVDGEIFWGQDRLDLLQRALALPEPRGRA